MLKFHTGNVFLCFCDLIIVFKKTTAKIEIFRFDFKTDNLTNLINNF